MSTVVTWHYPAARARKARRTVFILRCYIIVSFFKQKEFLNEETKKRGRQIMKTLIICQSYHHGNTKKIADAMAAVLKADVVSPRDVKAEELEHYDLIGFGSGIAFGKHYRGLNNLVDRLPDLHKNAFIFSTRGDKKLRGYHRALRRQLEAKGWVIVGEFSCRGFDTYGLTKLVGGVAKGRPNEQDLRDAVDFAQLLEKAE